MNFDEVNLNYNLKLNINYKTSKLRPQVLLHLLLEKYHQVMYWIRIGEFRLLVIQATF